MAIYSWLAFFVGIVAVITNEATIHAKYYRLSVENSSINSFEGFFHASVTPLAAAIWIFVDLSVIHLSFIASCYQRQLRHQIDRWAEHDLQFKEKIRMAYKTVQSIVKVSFISKFKTFSISDSQSLSNRREMTFFRRWF